jgi:NitT/TauT family transport system substrate-binding protein
LISSRYFLTFLLVTLLTAAGCREKKQENNGAARVRLAIGGQGQMVYLPATVAERLGYYRAEGLDIAAQDFPGGSKALESLLGGSADVVCGFYDHTIQMAAEGREMRAFVAMLRYPGFVLAVSPATTRHISKIEDLKGTVAGVTAPGSSSNMILNYLLIKHGMSAQDVSITGIGATATAVAAMERGKVDAAIMFDPAITQLEKRVSRISVLEDTRSEEGVERVFGVKNYPASVFYSDAGWISRNPDVARRLARAILKTLQWMQQHSPEEIMEKMPEPYRGQDPAVYLEALKHSLPMYSPDGQISRQGAEAVKAVLSLSVEKVRNANVDVDKTFTNEFITMK